MSVQNGKRNGMVLFIHYIPTRVISLSRFLGLPVCQSIPVPPSRAQNTTINRRLWLLNNASKRHPTAYLRGLLDGGIFDGNGRAGKSGERRDGFGAE